MKRSMKALFLAGVAIFSVISSGCVYSPARPYRARYAEVWVPAHWEGPRGDVWVGGHWR